MRSIPPNWRKVVEELELGEERADLLGACISARAEERPADAADLAERLAWCPVEQRAFFPNEAAT
jgi:hypothetical protein